MFFPLIIGICKTIKFPWPKPTKNWANKNGFFLITPKIIWLKIPNPPLFPPPILKVNNFKKALLNSSQVK